MAELHARLLQSEQLASSDGSSRQASGKHSLCVLAATAVATGVASTLLWPPRPVLLWNASPSSPIGLYAVSSPKHLRVGDVALAWAPAPVRRLAAARQYLPADVPLVKRVAALAGDRVCAKGKIIFVNDRAAALRRDRDPSGRPMPWWSGCRVLRPGELLLLSRDAPHAFDGRYFGVSRTSQIIGKARLLWPR
jgi:conjugative transfer signal peptidase TraF